MSAEVLLLDVAMDYALDAIDTVRPELLSQSTPCSEWNLRMLLSHACESVAALQEGVCCGRVDLFPTDHHDALVDPTRCLRGRIMHLRDEWVAANGDRSIAVADQLIPLSLMTCAAALEITVHGWDVFRGSGCERPIPAGLAADLLAISPRLVPDDARHRLFAPPVRTAATATPGERLLAYLGRPSAGARSIEMENPS